MMENSSMGFGWHPFIMKWKNKKKCSKPPISPVNDGLVLLSESQLADHNRNTNGLFRMATRRPLGKCSEASGFWPLLRNGTTKPGADGWGKNCAHGFFWHPKEMALEDFRMPINLGTLSNNLMISDFGLIFTKVSEEPNYHCREWPMIIVLDSANQAKTTAPTLHKLFAKIGQTSLAEFIVVQQPKMRKNWDDSVGSP